MPFGADSNRDFRRVVTEGRRESFRHLPGRRGELAGLFDRSFGRRGITAWHYGGGLAYELSGGDVRPFLLVGVGGVTWDGASDTGFVFRFGAGLKALFGNVGFRVDVTDHLVVDHFLTGDNEHDVHATAGLLVEF